MRNRLSCFILICLVCANPLLYCGIAALESSDRNALEKQSPRTLKKIDHNEQLSTDDIKKMSRAGLSDDTIITEIHETKSIFYLSSADIVDLKKSGVSQKIINYMIQTGNK